MAVSRKHLGPAAGVLLLGVIVAIGAVRWFDKGVVCTTHPVRLLPSTADVWLRWSDSSRYAQFRELPGGRYHYSATTGTKDFLFFQVADGDSIEGYVVAGEGVSKCTE